MVARNLGVSSGNDYALLEALGGDCAGALTVLEPGEELPSRPRARALDEEQLDTVLRELPQRPLAAESGGGDAPLSGGRTAEAAGDRGGRSLSLPLNTAAATTHILKPEPARFPGLVDNEAFCMELGAAVGLPVAHVEKRTSSSGLAYLLVERYDRDLTSDPIRRLHQEDFCQALGQSSDCKYQADGGPMVVETVSLLRAARRVPAQDLIAFWRALVFNWLIGNCDAHAKNFSLLYDGAVPTLAPLYDLLATTIYPELTSRLAMSLGGARQIDEVTAEAWGRLAVETHYSERFVVKETRGMIARVSDEMPRLLGLARHDNEAAGLVAEGIRARIGAFSKRA